MLGRFVSAIMEARGKGAFFLTILAGAISVLGFAPFYIWPAFILMLAGFFVRLHGIARREDSHKLVSKAAFWAGWAFGFGTFVAGTYWLSSAFITRGGFYVWLSPIGIFGLPLGLAFFWAFAAKAYVYFLRGALKGKSIGLCALAFTTIIFLMEYLRGHILSGFPWNLPGYIWEAGGSMSQIASLIGIYGLSALAIFISATFGTFLMNRQGGTQAHWALPVIAAALFIGVFTYGTQRLDKANVEYVTGTHLRVVTLDIRQQDKFARGGYGQTINRYLEASTAPFETRPTHVIWPEGAIPGFVLEDAELMTAMGGIFHGGPDVLMGLSRREMGEDAETRYYNSVAVLSPQSGTMVARAVYDKTKLVPFGEFFPGASLIEEFDIPALTAAVSSFDRGTGNITPLPNLPSASIQICYEVIFPGFAKRSAKADIAPQWILNVSNDSWFGKSTGPHQHFNQARYRAIEEGMPLVRSASSGFSGFVDPYGRVLKSLPLGESGVIDHPLPKAVFE